MLVRQTTVTIEKHELMAAGGNPAPVLLRYVAAPNEPVVAEAPPTVFVLHGLNSRKERHLDVCLRLAQAGFAACAPDAALHGERVNRKSRRLSDMTAPEFLPTFIQVMQQTVEDVAHFATELGLQSYGLIGHSMGGFIALHTLLADPRARAVVVVGGALDVSLAGQIAPSYADPALRADEFLNRPVLLLHGDNDETVPVAGARRLHAALSPLYESEAASRLSFIEIAGGGHEWTDAIAEQAVQWMQAHLIAEPTPTHDA